MQKKMQVLSHVDICLITLSYISFTLIYLSVLILICQELEISRDPHFSAFLDIIVLLELCSPPSTNVLWVHGVVTVDWRLKVSASHVHMAGTVWLVQERHQVDAALDTTVLKVNMNMLYMYICVCVC